MIPWLLLIVTILLSLVALYTLNHALNYFGISKAALALLAISLFLFVYLYGTWVFASVYLRYVLAFVFTARFVSGLLCKKPLRSVSKSLALNIICISFSLLLFTINVLYYTGTTGDKYRIANLHLPFKNGNYFVFQGGKGLPTNVFHYKLRGAVFAMDIVKLNKFGNRANNVFSSSLLDYEIYNDTIYSPCSGVVLHIENNNPDNIPPNRKRGPTNTNQVLIGTDSAYVFLAHFKFNSVFVKNGDKVEVGYPLGLAGNSGFSLEPHLHIQCHTRTNPKIPWYKEKPLMMEFDGKQYLLFETIKAEK